jgi:ferredoxin-type protein NapG
MDLGSWWKKFRETVGAPNARDKLADDLPINRRRFFRAGLNELIKPLASAVQPLAHVANQFGKLDPPQLPSTRSYAAQSAAPHIWPSAGSDSLDEPVPTSWLRPPGALPEVEFHDTCSRCGTCVNVCPVQCIKIDPNCIKGEGVPYIEVDVMPCVLCEGLNCMQHCPSGALVPTILAQIDMGTAVLNEHSCLRSHGEGCTVCVDHCPVGAAALELLDGRINVKEDGCTGCGVCQHDCPTMPRSITVIPKSARPHG